MFNIKTAILAAAATAAILGSSNAALAISANSSTAEIAQWTTVHTEAPSHFSAQAPLAHFGQPQQPQPFFSGAAAGPTGAQFGREPVNNTSLIDPTRNSLNAHQTQNSTQATNALESTQAVQGRNCTLMAIKAGFCQGR
jgi:hypothetical protein